jgi:hypothetical protein
LVFFTTGCCQAKLEACNTNLDHANTQLATCNAELGAAQNNYSSCIKDKAYTAGQLAQTQKQYDADTAALRQQIYDRDQLVDHWKNETVAAQIETAKIRGTALGAGAGALISGLLFSLAFAFFSKHLEQRKVGKSIALFLFIYILILGLIVWYLWS